MNAAPWVGPVTGAVQNTILHQEHTDVAVSQNCDCEWHKQEKCYTISSKSNPSVESVIYERRQ